MHKKLSLSAVAVLMVGGMLLSTGAMASGSPSSTLVPPKYEGPTTPDPAPSGIKLGIISCSQTLQGCVTLAAGSAAAAASAGWTSTTYDGQSNTTIQNTQISDAIAAGANVIELIAINPATVQTGLAIAQKAGALIIGADNGGSAPNPVIKAPAGDIWPIVDVSANYAALAETTAKWIISSSNHKANVLVYGDKEYPAVIEGVAALVKTLKTCSTCKVSPVQYFVANDIATTVGPNVVSYLRTHPKVNYIYAPYDPSAPTMVTAIDAAGMKGRVKLVSYLGDSQNLGYVKSGNVQAADGAVDNTYNGYAVVDQIIRHLDHLALAVPYNEKVPTEVLTKSNVGNAASLKTGWVAPYNYIAEYAKLWK